MQKITIKGVNHKEVQKKDGSVFLTCGILTDLNGKEEWINGYGNARTQALNKGESIFLDIYEEEYNGKVYKKFRLPSLDHIIANTTSILEAR